MGDQKLLPWRCATASYDMDTTLGDLTELSTGFDLGMLLLGKARARRITLRRRISPEALFFAPLLGISVE